MTLRQQKQLLKAAQAVCEDLRELHRHALNLQSESRVGHTALEMPDDTKGGPDLPCAICGNINEAEYEIAVAMAEWGVGRMKSIGELA